VVLATVGTPVVPLSGPLLRKLPGAASLAVTKRQAWPLSAGTCVLPITPRTCHQ
jgi:hypothetical protein